MTTLRMKRIMIPFLLLLLLPLAVCHGSPGVHESRLKRLLGPGDAALLVNPEGKTVFAHRPDAPMVPASILKIATSLVAFDVLGPDYRFVTDFFVDGDNNLYIKGYGDPMLVSEDVQSISATLAGSIRRINHLFLDATHFTSPIAIPGTAQHSLKPYDAGIGALCVNFNTVNFSHHADGRIESAEPQTPLIPFVLDRIGRSDARTGRISLSTRNDEHVLYAGHLFAYFLEEEGVRLDGEVRLATVPADHVRRVHRHRSVHSMKAMASGLMTYSNNFIANQLLIACGVEAFGPPGTLAKGVETARRRLGKHLPANDFVMVEGSGLSRSNRFSCRLMDRILVLFTPYRSLMRREGNEYYKTGTLSGVQTRAGYFETPDGRLFRFVVMINTPDKAIHPVMEALRARVGSTQP